MGLTIALFSCSELSIKHCNIGMLKSGSNSLNWKSMNTIISLPYMSAFFGILASLFLGLLLTACILTPLKKTDYIYSFALMISILIYFTLQVTPTPRQLDRILITQWMHLDNNKVASNGMRNEILMVCSQRGFLDGYHYRKAVDAFNKDIDRHLKGTDSTPAAPSFDIDSRIPDKAQAYTDVCRYAANNYEKSASF